MQVQDVMSRDPICCERDSYIADIARLMAQYDCGEIPVCDERGRPVGVVTDRDIVCRIIAREELASYQDRYPVISTKLFGGRTVVRVYGDSQPGEGFESVEADLEDVYFAALNLPPAGAPPTTATSAAAVATVAAATDGVSAGEL